MSLFNNTMSKFISCLFFICLMSTALSELHAQSFSKDNYNFREFEQKPFYFGIQLGGGTSGYKITQSKPFFIEDSLQLVQSPLTPGLAISFIGNLKIGEFFDFRTTPGFSFSERKFEFRSATSALYEKKIETYTFDIPLLLRFKSAPYKDKRLFIVAGVKYVYDFSSNVNAEGPSAQELLVLSPHDFQFEVGAGIQFFMPYFIFSPQLSFSQSISNIHITKRGLIESRIIDQVLSRLFTIHINLEG